MLPSRVKATIVKERLARRAPQDAVRLPQSVAAVPFDPAWLLKTGVQAAGATVAPSSEAAPASTAGTLRGKVGLHWVRRAPPEESPGLVVWGVGGVGSGPARRLDEFQADGGGGGHWQEEPGEEPEEGPEEGEWGGEEDDDEACSLALSLLSPFSPLDLPYSPGSRSAPFARPPSPPPSPLRRPSSSRPSGLSDSRPLKRGAASAPPPSVLALSARRHGGGCPLGRTGG